ncbi:hypothetical protein K1719_003167 [Acacia pycnantha]|nr:hypothetical protein K1719_003167 [Acacia pycnantha]
MKRKEDPVKRKEEDENPPSSVLSPTVTPPNIPKICPLNLRSFARSVAVDTAAVTLKAAAIAVDAVSNKRGKSLIIDPGLYSLKKSEIWWVSKQRSLPAAFKLYTGIWTTLMGRKVIEANPL